MLLISSSMFTVLPTPAPPNRPILPPLANGQIRSITLMPVSSSSTDGDSSSNLGAGWWIERRSSDLIGPASSIGRPSTSMMRPSVPGPTGTEIGAPVLLHLHAAAQAVGGAQRDAAHDAVAELLLDLEGQALLGKARSARVLEHQRVVDLGHALARKLDVGHRADALDDGSLIHDSGPMQNSRNRVAEAIRRRPRRRRFRKVPW